MRVAKTLLPLVACGLLQACTTLPIPVTYEPDAAQRRQINLLENVAPTAKASIEFTTNTEETATFSQHIDGELCHSDDSKTLARVARARSMPDVEDSIRKVSAVLSLGATLLVDPRRSKTPHVQVNEVEAGKDMVVQAYSYVYTPTGALSCGPLFMKFRPIAERTYRMSFSRHDKQCSFAVLEVLATGVTQPAPHARWGCSKNFLGLPDKPYGYQEQKQ